MPGNPMPDPDQLQPEDTLIQEPTGDVLDTGYEPPDSRRGRRLDEITDEADRQDTIEQRMAQEVPEDPQLPGQPLRRSERGVDQVDETLISDQAPDDESELVADTDGPLIDASPEEDAMHVIEEDQIP